MPGLWFWWTQVFHIQCLGCLMPEESEKWFCPRHACAVCGLQDRVISKSETVRRRPFPMLACPKTPTRSPRLRAVLLLQALVQCPTCPTSVCPSHSFAWTELQQKIRPQPAALPSPSPSAAASTVSAFSGPGAAAFSQNGRRSRGRAAASTASQCQNCRNPSIRVRLGFVTAVLRAFCPLNACCFADVLGHARPSIPCPLRVLRACHLDFPLALLAQCVVRVACALPRRLPLPSAWKLCGVRPSVSHYCAACLLRRLCRPPCHHLTPHPLVLLRVPRLQTAAWLPPTAAAHLSWRQHLRPRPRVWGTSFTACAC